MPDNTTVADVRPITPADPLRSDGHAGDPLPTDDAPSPPVGRAGDLGDRPGPGFFTRVVAVVAAMLLVMAGGAIALVWLLSQAFGSLSLNPFASTTVDRSGQPVLQSLTDLKTYQAASGYYEILIDRETDVANLPSFLAGDRVLFVAAGTVAATVDFSGIDDGVTTNADRTAVTVALPAVQLGAPQLDLERSYVADHRRGLRERLQDAVGAEGGAQDTQELYRLAQTRLAEAGARTDDLKQRARANTRAMLTSLLTQAGYSTVTVTFADE
jgi:hypothetical protein